MEQDRKTKYENKGPKSYSFDEWINNFDQEPKGY
jgi:hypothetical protein